MLCGLGVVSAQSTQVKVNTLDLLSISPVDGGVPAHTHPMVPYLPASCEMVTDTSRPNVVTL